MMLESHRGATGRANRGRGSLLGGGGLALGTKDNPGPGRNCGHRKAG